MSIANETKDKKVEPEVKQPIVEEPKVEQEMKNYSYVKEITNFGKGKLTEEQKKKASKMIEAARKADSKLVKGVFKNLECPGGDLQFAYHAYKGEPTRVYHMIDGNEYEIPLGVAKHINKQCKYKKSKYLVDKQGNKMLTADKPIERYQFVSGEFM